MTWVIASHVILGEAEGGSFNWEQMQWRKPSKD